MSIISDDSNKVDLDEYGNIKITWQSVNQNKYVSNDIEVKKNNKRRLELISNQDKENYYYK